MTGRRAGTWAWVGLAGYVAGYDAWALRGRHETLSAAFCRAVAHPRRRWAVIGAWSLLTKHLFLPRWLPQIDPLGWAAHALTKEP